MQTAVSMTCYWKSMITRFLFSAAVAGLSFPATAEIFACRDAAGVVSYSLTTPAGPCYDKVGRRGGERVAASSPADFPRVDAATQRSRDNDRRRILEAELAEESRLQADAQRTGRVELVAHHGRNIAMIQKELAYAK